MIITRTPLRISFFGGGTDHPAWYKEHGGAVLSTSIDKYCCINLRYQPPFFESRYRIAYRKIELCKSIEEIKHPSVRACLDYTGIKDGLELVYAGDLPARSGLGSSSTFTVGLLNAIYTLKGKRLSQEELARRAIYVEQEVIGEPVGSQDQTCAAHGGLNLIRFGDDISVHPVPLSHERKTILQKNLMMFYTGVSRFGANIERDKVSNIGQRKATFRAMLDMVDEGTKILTSSTDLDDFGRLLHETWLLKQKTSNKVSTSLVDDLYERAMAHGALGGKLLGAGGGGFILLYVPQEKQEAMKQALAPHMHIPFRFENMGTHVLMHEMEENDTHETEPWNEAGDGEVVRLFAR